MLKKIYYYRNLIWIFVVRDLKGRYVGSTMGLFWSLINPVITLLLFLYVFSVILKVKFGQNGSLSDFALYLFCGMLPWLAFQETIIRSTNSIVENANLIKKFIFPSKIFPVYLSISSLVNELIGLVVLIIAIILITHKINYFILFLPLIIIFQLIFTMGLGWIVACINVFFRDIAHLMGMIMMTWMFLTPIFYPESMVPEKFQFFIKLNPMAYLVRAYRDILLSNRFPSITDILTFIAISIIVFFGGYYLFGKTQPKFSDVV